MRTQASPERKATFLQLGSFGVLVLGFRVQGLGFGQALSPLGSTRGPVDCSCTSLPGERSPDGHGSCPAATALPEPLYGENMGDVRVERV